ARTPKLGLSCAAYERTHPASSASWIADGFVLEEAARRMRAKRARGMPGCRAPPLPCAAPCFAAGPSFGARRQPAYVRWRPLLRREAPTAYVHWRPLRRREAPTAHAR